MKLKKIISLTMVFLLFIASTFTIHAQSVTISNLSPHEGDEIELIKDGSLAFSCDVSGAKITKFLLNGEVFAEFNNDGHLSFSLSHSDIGLGNKSFEVVVLDSDGRIHTQSIDFTSYVNYKGKVNSGVSTDIQDFNTLSDAYANKTAELTSLNDFGWTITGSGFKIRRLEGKSGAEGDYSLGVYPTKNTGVSLKLNGWTQAVTSGKIYLEYDWKMQPFKDPEVNSVMLTMRGLPVNTTHGGIKLSGSKTLYDTGFAPAVSKDTTSSEWINMRYEYDVDTGKCSLWINGTQYWNNITAIVNATNNLSQLILIPTVEASWWYTNGVAFFMLDNFQLYMKEKLSLDLMTYQKGGTPTAFSDASVPFGADSVTARFSSPIGSLSNSDIELYADGKKLTHGGISVDGNELTVNLPSGLSNRDITIKSRKGLENFGDIYVPGGLSFKFHIDSKITSSTDILVNSSASGSSVSLTSGDVVSAEYTAQNLSNADQDILLVLTVRENGSLVSVSAKEIKALANNTDTFTLPSIAIQESGNYDISLIAVGGFLTPETFN